MIELYVSPDGSDAHTGRCPDPEAPGGAGPLRTLPAAQQAVRRIKAALPEPEAIRVNLRGGRYELEEPLRFHAEDGGLGRTTNRLARTWPVTWAAYGDEVPQITGGCVIPGPWTPETVNGVSAYTTTPPPALLERGAFTQLWVGGERRHRPRLPKAGLWQVERGFHEAADFDGPGHNKPSDACVYREGQIRADWRNLEDVALHFFAWWIDRWVKIRRVEAATRTVHFDRTAKLRMAWKPGDGVDYVAENVFEALTEPGEWYLDRHAKKLYYIPVPGERMDEVEVVAGRLPKLLEIDGGGRWRGQGEGHEDLAGGGGGHLRFEGLTFAHAEWRLPDEEAGEKQGAIHVPGAITVRGAEGCVFQNCRIEHVSTYAAAVSEGSVETVFDHCTMSDLGAGGVVIWHGCRRNAVQDCEIGEGGLIHAAACGVLIGRASGNRVIHNHIHDFYYTGVSAGWNWGYAESHGYGNVIEWNHIHDLGKGLLSDMGGIYLLGHACGTRLRYNHIHEITCRRYGGWAMYTDEGSTEVLMESNLCYRTNKNAFHQHYGRHNTLRNNILAYGGEAVLAYGKPEPHLGLRFERNIFLSSGPPILRKWAPDRWTPSQACFDGNLYWCEDGEVRFETGGMGLWGTQPFPEGYLAARHRYDPLGEAAEEAGGGAPSEADWDRAPRVGPFVSASGEPAAGGRGADVRMLRRGGELWVRARFERPERFEPIGEAPLWHRERLELLLKPFPTRPAVVQFGLASDGESALLWHEAEAPASFDWQAGAEAHGPGWQATLRIPLEAAAAAVAGGAQETPDWRFMLGFAVPSAVGDFAAWQAAGHDAAGRVADPGFLDPAAGDFRLAEGSPARAMGFLPWDVSRAGPR